MTLGGGY